MSTIAQYRPHELCKMMKRRGDSQLLPLRSCCAYRAHADIIEGSSGTMAAKFYFVYGHVSPYIVAQLQEKCNSELPALST